MHNMTIAELGRKIRAGELSPLELTEGCLARIEALDGKLNAFRVVCRDRALCEAEAAELALRSGRVSNPLQGIPYAAKDIFDVAGLPTTAGTHLLAKKVAKEDAGVISRLAQAGMILIGKTNTVQFAYSGVGINHDHGTPHNPWHAEHHVPGGSSSGSAVALAAGMVPMALGSDTGGSVRIPASLCGTTALKTTPGRISRKGVYPLSWSLDSVGPMTRSVEDAALVYQCLQGIDLEDRTTWGIQPYDVLGGLKDGVAGMRLAFPETVFWEKAVPDVVEAVRECGKVFQSLGAQVSSIDLPEAREARDIFQRGFIIAAEGYTNNKEWLQKHFEELDPVVAFRMIKGKDISATEYLEDELKSERLQFEVNAKLRDIDALLVPATFIPAVPVDEVDRDNSTYTEFNLSYLRNTSIGNILNLCGLAVPCGFSEKGLPIGLMIYGKSFQEDVVLRVGYAFQQVTDWHRHLPDLAWIG